MVIVVIATLIVTAFLVYGYFWAPEILQPTGPQKLGENSKYVFALPPRWVGFTNTLGQDEA